jgi:carboxyl-terminal processing protease
MYRRNRSIVVIVLTVVALMGVGWVVGSERVQAIGEKTYNLNLLYQIVNQIRAKYVDELDEQEAIDAAIRGMLGTLDPYTEFLEKKQNDEMKMMQIEGKYGGLGIKITKQDDALVVVALFDDTPAYDVGLQTGDRIVKIEGQSTADIDVTRAADLLRGEPGTTVTISVQRDDEDKSVEYTITRAIITIPVVPYAGTIQDNIGYIKLNQFTEDASAEVERALRRMKEQRVQGVVLDLRGNPGGLLEQAVAVASKFLEEGRLVVYTKGRNTSQEKSYHASSSFIVRDIPLVVLVDEWSASASEIVAGAIQDWDRGVVVGTPTFGKALVQQIFPMSDGTALKITTARYYTPSGRLIQKMPRNPAQPHEQAGADQPPDTSRSVEQYKTNGGRVVYGGGGIMPDFNVPLPQLPRVVAELADHSLFVKFASSYTTQHPGLKAEDFQVTDAMLEAFRRFIGDKGFSYATEAEQALDQLEALVKKQPVDQSVFDTITTLRAQLIKEHAADFEANRELIKARIGSEIGAKLWGSSGRYVYAVKHDPQIQAAIDILRDQKKYNQHLSVRTAGAPYTQVLR